MKRSEVALGELAELMGQLARLESRRDTLVARARLGGATWAQIGDVLGVSAQAAHKRYRDLRYDAKIGRAWREEQLSL